MGGMEPAGAGSHVPARCRAHAHQQDQQGVRTLRRDSALRHKNDSGGTHLVLHLGRPPHHSGFEITELHTFSCVVRGHGQGVRRRDKEIRIRHQHTGQDTLWQMESGQQHDHDQQQEQEEVESVR